MSRMAVDNAMYSALVVESAISVCILLAHIIGQPAKLITKLGVRDRAVAGSSAESFDQVPAKSAST